MEISSYLHKPQREHPEETPLVVPKVIRQYTRKKKVPLGNPVENKVLPTNSIDPVAGTSIDQSYSKLKVVNHVKLKEEPVPAIKIMNSDNNSGQKCTKTKLNNDVITIKRKKKIPSTTTLHKSDIHSEGSPSTVKIKKEYQSETEIAKTGTESDQNSSYRKQDNNVKIKKESLSDIEVINTNKDLDNSVYRTVDKNIKIKEEIAPEIVIKHTEVIPDQSCSSSISKVKFFKNKQESVSETEVINTEVKGQEMTYIPVDNLVNIKEENFETLLDCGKERLSNPKMDITIKVEKIVSQDLNLDRFDDKNNADEFLAISDVTSLKNGKSTKTRDKSELILGNSLLPDQTIVGSNPSVHFERKTLITEEIHIKEEIESDTDMDDKLASVRVDIKKPGFLDVSPAMQLSNFNEDTSIVPMMSEQGDKNSISAEKIALKKCVLVAVNIAPADSQKIGIPGNVQQFKVVAKSRIVTCEMCGEHFLRKNDVRAHVRAAHRFTARFPCPQCSTRFPYHFLLLAHMRTHSGKHLDCDLCEKRFKSAVNFAYHLNSHLRERLFSCPVCLRRFTKQEEVQRHAARHTPADQFPCDDCDAKLRCALDLNRHRERVHGEKGHYPCYVCSRVFSSDSDLVDHLEKHDGAVLDCALCPRRFTDFRKYEEHSAKHLDKMHNDEMPTYSPHECEICKMRFVYRSTLKGHMSSHTRERPYKCSICPMSYKTRGALTEHEKGHSRPFPCGACGARFGKRDTLARHARLHSGERPYACAGCGAAFAQRTAWRLHVRRRHAPGLKRTTKKKTAKANRKSGTKKSDN